MAGEAAAAVAPGTIDEQFVPESPDGWGSLYLRRPRNDVRFMVAQARSQDSPHRNDPAGDRMAGRHAPGCAVTLWGEEGAPRPAPSLPDERQLIGHPDRKVLGMPFPPCPQSDVIVVTPPEIAETIKRPGQTMELTSPDTDGYAYKAFRMALAFTPARIASAKRLMTSSAWGPKMWAPRIRSSASSTKTL